MSLQMDPSTKVASSIVSPREKLSLSEEMLIEPLPASTISLEKWLRRDTECFACEDAPEIRVLTVTIQQFLD